MMDLDSRSLTSENFLRALARLRITGAHKLLTTLQTTSGTYQQECIHKNSKIKIFLCFLLFFLCLFVFCASFRAPSTGASRIACQSTKLCCIDFEVERYLSFFGFPCHGVNFSIENLMEVFDSVEILRVIFIDVAAAVFCFALRTHTHRQENGPQRQKTQRTESCPSFSDPKTSTRQRIKDTLQTLMSIEYTPLTIPALSSCHSKKAC